MVKVPGEYVYHINRKWKDDRIENLKIIDISPVDIEVKHPYDPKRYTGRRRWDNQNKHYGIVLYLKSEYKENKDLKERIELHINRYVAETELLKRFLKKDNESVIFKDGDYTNYKSSNLKVVEGMKSIYPVGKVPFQDFYIGTKFKNKQGRECVYLYDKNTVGRAGQTSIMMSKYKYLLKLGRLLNRDEYIDYIDGDATNESDDNITHRARVRCKAPFEDYYEGRLGVDKRDGRARLDLSKIIPDGSKPLTMYLSRYKMQVMLGRLLNSDEEVDHIDSDQCNDDDDNLTRSFYRRS